MAQLPQRGAKVPSGRLLHSSRRRKHFEHSIMAMTRLLRMYFCYRVSPVILRWTPGEPRPPPGRFRGFSGAGRSPRVTHNRSVLLPPCGRPPTVHAMLTTCRFYKSITLIGGIYAKR